MMDELKNWLLKAKGQRLNAVLALVHCHEGEKNFSHPQELSLRIWRSENGRLRCSGDGSSIEWRKEEMEPSDLGEYGEQIIEDVSCDPTWSKAVGKILEDVGLVEASIDKSIIGIQFSFEGEHTIYALNLGDELFILDQIPKQIMNEEKIQIYHLA